MSCTLHSIAVYLNLSFFSALRTIVLLNSDKTPTAKGVGKKGGFVNVLECVWRALPGPTQGPAQTEDDDPLVLLGDLEGEEEGEGEGGEDDEEGADLQEAGETLLCRLGLGRPPGHGG